MIILDSFKMRLCVYTLNGMEKNLTQKVRLYIVWHLDSKPGIIRHCKKETKPRYLSLGYTFIIC